MARDEVAACQFTVKITSHKAVATAREGARFYAISRDCAQRERTASAVFA